LPFRFSSPVFLPSPRDTIRQAKEHMARAGVAVRLDSASACN